MPSNKTFICDTCNYTTNRKYNLELHKRSPNACKKKLMRHGKNIAGADVTQNGVIVTTPGADVTQNGDDVTINENNIIEDNCCKKCNKQFVRRIDLIKHEIKCNGTHSLQCPTCKLYFSTRQQKYRHIKKGNCELVLTEEQQKIKDLEEQLEQKEQALEESEIKRKEAENKCGTTVNNYNITNNTNNYFDHSINYNNYDNLNVDHITKEDIKRLFNNCRMQYPELSEDLTRMILSPKENQCIFLPEGQKSNTCAVIKDGVEMRKPLIRVLMDLGVQTATLIRDSNVIVRNKKDVVNNQFWADNRNACGLNISDIEYMTENDKEIVQRNKNIVLDMSDGKI